MVMSAQHRGAAAERRGKRNGKKAEGRSATNVVRAAGKTVQEFSDGLADSLMSSALRGDTATFRYLLELSQEPSGGLPQEVVHSLRSLAEELAAEPQWNERAADNAAETGKGEPES
jgi:hypothetical protein